MNMFKITNTGGLVKRFLNAFKDVEFQVLTAANHRLEQSAEASGGAIEVRSIEYAISDLHQTLRSFEKKVPLGPGENRQSPEASQTFPQKHIFVVCWHRNRQQR